MFHPFSEDLSELTLPQLEQRVAELSRKYFATQNTQLQSQISTFIDIYKQEIQIKIAKEKARQQENGDDGLDNLINVS